LDGTRAFVKGNLQFVTCLISLTYKGEPVVGLMGYPNPGYTTEEPTFNTEIYVGQIDTPKVLRLEWNSEQSQYALS